MMKKLITPFLAVAMLAVALGAGGCASSGGSKGYRSKLHKNRSYHGKAGCYANKRSNHR